MRLDQERGEMLAEQPPITPSAADKSRALFGMNKSYSVENGYPSRRRSLVDDAKFESQVNKETKETFLANIKLHHVPMDEELDEEEVFLTAGIIPTIAPEVVIEAVEIKADDGSVVPEKEVPADYTGTATLLIELKDGLSPSSRILKIIESCHGVIDHLETRVNPFRSALNGTNKQEVKDEKDAKDVDLNKSNNEGKNKLPCDMLVSVEISRESLVMLLKLLRHSPHICKAVLLSEKLIGFKEPWYPIHISELDLCNHVLSKFEPDLDSCHPGFSDVEYRNRRKRIAEIAFAYKHGDPIPRVEYSQDEIKVWKMVYNRIESLLPTHACIQYRDIMDNLRREGGYLPDAIPQLEDVSNFLQKKTGFRLRPAAGLLTARDFLSSLAHRVFQCTQYVRHPSEPEHSPEPDCIHELLGHVPMLADPTFAQFSQELGLASLGATDEEIERFATLYWFTVEFGLCREGADLKAYGAGLLSSFGELEHALSDKPAKLPFDPDVTSVQKYQDQDFQDTYFVAESIEDVMEKFRRWTSTALSRNYEVAYDAYTSKVIPLDSVANLERLAKQVKIETNRLNNAIHKLNFKAIAA